MFGDHGLKKLFSNFSVFDMRPALSVNFLYFTHHIRRWKSLATKQTESTITVTIEIVEYSNRRKNQGYSKRRKNSIAAIIFRL